MKAYEIVATYLNGCAGDSYPQTEFIETELNDPADYVRQQHGKDFCKIYQRRSTRWAGGFHLQPYRPLHL